VGGILGAMFVGYITWVSPQQGVALTFALAVSGQIFASMVIDHYGLFGTAIRTITWEKIPHHYLGKNCGGPADPRRSAADQKIDTGRIGVSCTVHNMANPNLDTNKSSLSAADKEFENNIRPASIVEFSGQSQIIDNLKVFIRAAKMRGEALDHVLFHGPPGLGKTTLSRIVAHELGVNIRETSGPVIEKPADLAGLLTGLEKNDVLFIDEIHRLSTVVEEYLYAAMEDYRIDIMIDSGPNARSIQLSLNQFTLIGATTRSGLLTAPLLSRFAIKSRLEYYSADTLRKIVQRAANILQVKISIEAAGEIARRSRATPRIANGLLRRVRDFAQVLNDGEIDMGITKHALKALNVDEYGLDDMDNKILATIIDKFKGGPVGITTIATAVGEEPGTLEEVYEPFLIQEGFLQRTPRGREVTLKAYEHLGRQQPGGQPQLW